MLLPLFRLISVTSVLATGVGNHGAESCNNLVVGCEGTPKHQLDAQEVRRLDSSSPTAMPSSAPSVAPSVAASMPPSIFTTEANTEAPSVEPSNEAPVATTQLAALESFAVSVGADTSRYLEDWFVGDTSYCDYTGIGCDADGYIITLDLDQTALSGHLPESIGQLTRLRRFKALKNNLNGPLPASLAMLPDLRQLNLGRNRLTGSLPDVSGMFPKLRRLHLHSNDLNGTIPSSLCSLQTLDALDISNNPQIFGELPACFGDMEQLTTLRIRDIGLIGEIPSGLCGLRNLNDLTPNTFGCDAIACGAGYYEPTEGRQLTNETKCLLCNVTSNVIGSTTCVELDGNDVVTGAPTSSPAPSQSPSTSSSPSISTAPTQSPSSSSSPSVTPTLSVEPSSEPSTAPSTAPSLFPSAAPSGHPTVAATAANVTPNPTPAHKGTTTGLPTKAPVFDESSAPSFSPTRASVIGGINDSTGGGSSRSLNKSLAIPLFVLAALLCILAFFVLRRQRRRSQEEAEEDDESVSDGPGSPEDPPMSMADSVSYLYDIEDGATTDGGSRMTQLDDVSEIGGGYEVERTTGAGGLGATSYATSPKTDAPNESMKDDTDGSKAKSPDFNAGLLTPSKVLPRLALKRSRSDPKDGRVHPIVLSPEGKETFAKPYPIVLSPEGKQNSNPWLEGEKDKPKSKLGVYGSLFRSSSDLSHSSRVSVNTNTPILGATAKPSDANSDYVSDTDSETLSAKDDDGLLPGCHAFSLDGIREKLRLNRCESM